ncbi:MAG: chitobiase/beta-hexosaminidase C-terminal domain-containing protein, partial [Thermodesulfobacteriota bacterium]
MGSDKVRAGCRQVERMLGIAMILGLLLFPGFARAANLQLMKDGTGTILAFSMAVMPPVAAQCGSQCELTVPAGSRVTITAAADAGTTFLGWSEGGCAGNLPSCDITLNADLTLTAYFSDGNGPPAPPADVVPPLTTATPPGGIHTEPVDVTLTANEEATIHYTVDGSSPSRQSPVYTGPVRITPSGVLRFFAVDAGGNIEAEQEERYLFLRGDVDASREIGLADTIAALDAQTDRQTAVDLRSDVDGDTAIGAGESLRPLQVLTLPDGEALITDLPPRRVAMAASALGKVTFNRDGGHSASSTYPADGKAFHLQITDGAGRLWSLDIPGDALLVPTSIRISALKDIASATMPGVIGAGVFLEPDGLKFLAPATLTVTPPAGGSPGMLLLGSGLGDNLEFGPSVLGQGSVSTIIWHFSTAYVSDDEMNAMEQQAMDALKERALADYASAKAAAAELLRQKPITAPAPPDLSFNCYGTAAYKEPAAQLARYEKEVFSPENEVMARLLGVG